MTSSKLNIKWSKYIPEDKKPTPKQLAYLSLPHTEAFYGGAASGGKSEAILFGALAWCDTPGFKGLIIRRTHTDMLLPSSILNRALNWLNPFMTTKEVKYNRAQHTFYFPSGAELAFGYLKSAGSEERYQSSEYNYIAFDELTHFLEHEYVYLFSRLRGTTEFKGLPSKMRSASNPGGQGHLWVKKRFGIQKDLETGKFIGTKQDMPFIPATVYDNPYVDKQYIKNLEKLGKLERDRLKDGDWDATDQSIFDNHWFMNRWGSKTNGLNTWYHLQRYDRLETYMDNEISYFCTVDCAASVKTGVKGMSYIKDREPSWSCISTWGVTPKYDMLMLDCHRFQTTIPELVQRISDNNRMWKPLYSIIEKNGPGEGVYQLCQQRGLPVKGVHSAHDKVQNSIAAQIRAEEGKIWLPTFKPWLRDFEDELYAWTGAPTQTDDQVDTLSNAANEVMEIAVGYERDLTLRRGIKRAIPIASMGSPIRLEPKAIGGNERLKTASRAIYRGFRNNRGGLEYLR